MGHTVDNINLSNIAMGKDSYIKGQGENTGSDFCADKTASVSEDVKAGYKFELSERKLKDNSTMDNFEDYLKHRQEKVKEAGRDEAAQEREEKDAAKEIARSLSRDEIKQLQMMGIDVTGASLSDILGVVNTMRGKNHREQTAQLLAKAAVSDGDMEDITFVGGKATLAGTDVELDNIDVTDVVADKADTDQDFMATDNELVYLIKNGLQPTKENMYKAHYSGSKAGKEGAKPELMQEMQPQIEKVILQAGFKVEEDTLKAAQFMLENQLPITTDNLRTYMEYKELMGKNISQVKLSENITEDKITSLYKDVMSIDPKVVYDMALADKQLTIAAIKSYMADNQGVSGRAEILDGKRVDAATRQTEVLDSKTIYAMTQENGNQEDKELYAVTAMRQMEEIRLSMTLEAAGKLVKSDINIDTRELTKVVSRLKSMEEKLIQDKLKQAQVPVTSENVTLYKELGERIQGLGQLHSGVLAAPLRGEDFTVNSLHIDNKRFQTAVESYEAVGTAPRSDLGDRISKAFNNVDDILREMGLPVEYENQRAVRILGYNSMEITMESIHQVANYDRQVNVLIDTFYPEAVLSMIKDGINPLDVPIDELNEIIRKKNYNQGVTEAENFATYLLDMEKQGLVNPEERESYIGLYRLMDKLAKSGDREVGWLFNNGADLTVRNLISAMRSRKASGINISVDDKFGLLTEVNVKGKDMEAQIESAFNTLNELQDVSKEAWEFMEVNNISASAVNALAVENMLNTPSGIYGMVSSLLAKMKFTTHAKEELVDEETENMKDSLEGEAVPVEFTEASIIESLKGSEEMSLKYDDLRDRLTELMYGAAAAGNITTMDIATVKTINAGFNILGSMARQDKYQVPVETKEGVKIMNLTILHEKANKGNIHFTMDGGSYGQLTGDLIMADGETLDGYIVSSGSHENYKLQEMKENMAQQLTAYGFNGTKISMGTIKEAGAVSVNREREDSRRLYQASVALIKTLGALM